MISELDPKFVVQFKFCLNDEVTFKYPDTHSLCSGRFKIIQRGESLHRNCIVYNLRDTYSTTIIWAMEEERIVMCEHDTLGNSVADVQPKYKTKDNVITVNGDVSCVVRVVGQCEDGTWLYELNLRDGEIYRENEIQKYTRTEDQQSSNTIHPDKEESTLTSAFR